MILPADVLLIDDSPSDRELAELAFEQALVPVSLRVAEDGEQGLELIRQAAPDVVFLDWRMPIVSGEQLLISLREEEIIPALKVVILSNSPSVFDRRRALALGARAFMVKPTNFDDLARHLDVALQFWTLAVQP